MKTIQAGIKCLNCYSIIINKNGNQKYCKTCMIPMKLGNRLDNFLTQENLDELKKINPQDRNYLMKKLLAFLWGL